MPLAHPIALVLATALIATSTWRGRLHPFLALLLAAAGFALLTGMSISQFGKSFGNGFGETVDSLGLPVLAAAMIAALAEPIVPFVLARLPLIPGLCGLGLVAGTAASAGGAFAILTPLRTRMAGRAPRRGALTLGLAISAGQAALLPSPVLIAATAILAAPWQRVVLFGLPLALIGAGLGAALASLAARTWPEPHDAHPAPAPVGTRNMAVAAGCLAMLALLIIQSVGYMPSEPWGGGSSRELILGVGRPVGLLCVGVAIVALATCGWRGMSESGWIAVAISRAAPLILLLGAAGGLQSLTQTVHMAELVAERVLPLGLGLAVPFLAAAAMKLLQGSSLTASITAAGMVQTMLPALGIGDDTGRALAVLAVGAGAMTGAHVNDGFFWLLADGAALRPARALLAITAATLAQGLLALGILVAFHAL